MKGSINATNNCLAKELAICINSFAGFNDYLGKTQEAFPSKNNVKMIQHGNAMNRV